MSNRRYFLSIYLITFSVYFFGQSNEIQINATLNTTTHELKIEQKVSFFNNSITKLDTLYFHNWPQAYKDKFTPLSKRLIENYDQSFYFSSSKNRGLTTIHSIQINKTEVHYFVPDDFPDVIGIVFQNSILPNNSVTIHFSYTVKIPLQHFTGYGRTKDNYYLRYWYLMPAIYQNQWQLQNNLDMDDLMVDFANYNINFNIPNAYFLYSDLNENLIENIQQKSYYLQGNQRQDVGISITKKQEYEPLQTAKTSVITNINSLNVIPQNKKIIAQRALDFLENKLGSYPHAAILINQHEYNKYPLYGLNQLPAFLNPFSDVVEWDLKFFHALSKKYLENTLSYQKQTDYWLVDGIQTYLMMLYVDTFYPEIKALGSVANYWGIRSYNFAKLHFNDQYIFLLNATTRANLDQSLITSNDSLSNLNRKIIQKYKAGLGLKYLDSYLTDSILPKTLKAFYKNSKLTAINSQQFLKMLKNNTQKNLNWFENDYLKTTKKLDYAIKKIEKKQDSIQISIQNNSNFTAPIKLYGLNQQKIEYQQWIENIDSTVTINISDKGFDRFALNYEFDFPENKLNNNFKFTRKKIFNKPLQIRLIKDIETPQYHQLFLSPEFRYNYYNGLIIGLGIHNRTMLAKNLKFKLFPSIGTKNLDFSGSYEINYTHWPKNAPFNIYQFSSGIMGSQYQYAPNLNYQSFIPFAGIEFNRKSLRSVSSSYLLAKYVMIQREQLPNQTIIPDSEKYQVFSLKYGFSNPNLIDELKYGLHFQYSKLFSKTSMLIQYRKLTDQNNRQIDVRLYAGTFLHHNTNTNFFDFSLGNATDYLFEYNYLGRSENSGIMSQQIIINEGGFKSKLPVSSANQWITTLNTSIGLWRWIELYNDIGLVKNKNQSIYFAHENGIRLNFVNNYFELYFPIHSNNGWEISQKNYPEKIRFVFTTDVRLLYNFFRRGFF